MHPTTEHPPYSATASATVDDMDRRLLILWAFAVTLLPQSGEAVTLIQTLGLFHLFVGLFLTATLIVFGASFGIYISRFGTWPTYRDVTIKALEWGVSMLMVLIFILGVVRYYQQYPKTMLMITAVVIILAIAIIVVRTAAGSGGDDDEKKAPAKKH